MNLEGFEVQAFFVCLPRVSGRQPRLTRNCILFTKMALPVHTAMPIGGCALRLPPAPRWRVGLNQSLVSPQGSGLQAHVGAVQWWRSPKKEQRISQGIQGTHYWVLIFPTKHSGTHTQLDHSLIYSFIQQISRLWL